MSAGIRFRATLSTLAATLGGVFSFVPFVPRLIRAMFTGSRDRQRTLELIRAGQHTGPDPAPDVSSSAPCILLIAGEPSGDLHGAALVSALRELAPEARLVGYGGSRMQEAGMELLADLASDPVMGVWPVIRRVPFFFGLYRAILIRLAAEPPDVIVGIDYPGLNLRIAAEATKRGVPFVEYIAPQVWAWAPWRVHSLAQKVARVVTILPFEKGIFEAAGAQAAYIGHPLFGHVAQRETDDRVGAALREGLTGPLVALLPGSRGSELAGCLPILLRAAQDVAQARPGTRFVIPLAAERLREQLAAALAGSAAAGLDIRVADPPKSDDAMAAADAAISVSGTATLHLVAHEVPAVIVYRASSAQRFLAGLLLVSPYFGLPNLLAGDEVLPEFLAEVGDAPAIASALLDLLPGGAKRDAALAALADMRERLTTTDGPERGARWVLATIDNAPPRR